MLFGEIASGGMATVRFGRLMGEVGFSRTVAVKCLHAHFAKDQEFARMFLDEARLAARVRHPNVVPILDVVARDGELFLVMDYVQGESLSKLVRAVRNKKTRMPLRIVASIMAGVLDGLHAAHEARSEHGEPLGIVHRDVSPQNVMVGLDGVSRVLDFGVAKAAGRLQTTREGQLKGKLAYMAPEQLKAEYVDRRTDIYAASVVLWEALTGRRLFKADDEIGIFGLVLKGEVPVPSSLIPSMPKGYDEVTLRGLHLDPSKRFATAREMAMALEKVAGVASPREVGAWVEELARDTLRKRAERIAELESVSSVSLNQAIQKAAQQDALRASGSHPGAASVVGSPTAHAPPPPPSRASFPNLPPPTGVATAVLSSPNIALKAVPVEEIDNEGDALTLISDTSSTAAQFSSVSAANFSAAHYTSLSMAQPPPAPRNTSTILAAVIGVSALLAMVVSVGLFFLVFRGTPDTDGASSGDLSANVPVLPPPTAGAEDAALAPEAAPSVPDASPEPDAAVVADAAPEAAVAAPPRTISTSVRPPPTRTTTSPPTTAAPPPTKTATPKRDECNPPYMIDARGLRVPKPQCL